MIDVAGLAVSRVQPLMIMNQRVSAASGVTLIHTHIMDTIIHQGYSYGRETFYRINNILASLLLTNKSFYLEKLSVSGI